VAFGSMATERPRMSGLTLLLVALGVSADAFAVSLAKGLQMRRLHRVDALAIATTFGVFQALMPLLGWFLGSRLRGYITSVDHWVAFGLLAVIGGKMIWESLRHDSSDEAEEQRVGLRELLVLGIATSIDALAVGISMAFLEVAIIPAVILIGVTTFVLSLGGVALGHRAGIRFRGPAELVGGLILIAIGTRVLLDHLGVW
jgi:putative Mn2+ efflux pump MntP